MANDLIAKLILSKKEIIHLYQGGLLSVRIKGKDRDAVVEISSGEVLEQKRRRIRFKSIDAE